VWEALLSITGSLLFGCASEPATGELYFKDDAWSPDGRRILVADRSRVGLMNPNTGAVQRLGKLPCGYFTSAVWTRRGEHPWPPPR
jgi:hypothetical protein